MSVATGKKIQMGSARGCNKTVWEAEDDSMLERNNFSIILRSSRTSNNTISGPYPKFESSYGLNF